MISRQTSREERALQLGPGAARDTAPAWSAVGSSPAGTSHALATEFLDLVSRATHGWRGSSEVILRTINVVVASLALLILSPLILLIAVAIKLDSSGPVFYRQLRIGLDRRDLNRADRRNLRSGGRRTADSCGRPFTIFKFRTMHMDAEGNTGPVWASRDDKRTTRVGRALRRYRLDEIPQFWNVVRADMAVVGPRPERPSFVQHLRGRFEHYPLRQRVPPGITGWAQVHREGDQSLDDVRFKLQYDLEYLRRRCLSFDLHIMLKTLPVMLEGQRSNGRGRRRHKTPTMH